MLESLKKALINSLTWSKKKAESLRGIQGPNARRSAYFAYQCCKQLNESIYGKLHCIKVPEDPTKRKTPGELLLDGLWTQDICLPLPRAKQPIQIPSKVCCAFECESNNGGREFFEDFRKLLLVSSPVKIFAGGIHHTTPKFTKDYTERRIEQIKELLENSPVKPTESDWYIAFWPSPEKKKDSKTLWDRLSDDDFSHLNNIKLFYCPASENFQFEKHA